VENLDQPAEQSEGADNIPHTGRRRQEQTQGEGLLSLLAKKKNYRKHLSKNNTVYVCTPCTRNKILKNIKAMHGHLRED
jgi:hypothetical protein